MNQERAPLPEDESEKIARLYKAATNLALSIQANYPMAYIELQDAARAYKYQKLLIILDELAENGDKLARELFSALSDVPELADVDGSEMIWSLLQARFNVGYHNDPKAKELFTGLEGESDSKATGGEISSGQRQEPRGHFPKLVGEDTMIPKHETSSNPHRYIDFTGKEVNIKDPDSNGFRQGEELEKNHIETSEAGKRFFFAGVDAFGMIVVEMDGVCFYCKDWPSFTALFSKKPYYE